MKRKDTKKNRAIILVLFIWMILSMGLTINYNNGKESNVLYLEESIYYVKSGDSLWSIASEITTDEEDIRSNVDKIKRDNNLKTNLLEPGDSLKIYKKIYREENDSRN